MQVGVRGRDLTLSRSGQRHIDALCLRKFNQAGRQQDLPFRPFAFAAQPVSDGWIADLR
jgi:hypothetical protein